MNKPRTKQKFLQLQRRQKEKDFAELSAQMERRDDPLEQAILTIRRRGFVVFKESDPELGWVVGGSRRQSALELVERAERLGFQVKEQDKRWRAQLARSSFKNKRDQSTTSRRTNSAS